MQANPAIISVFQITSEQKNKLLSQIIIAINLILFSMLTPSRTWAEKIPHPLAEKGLTRIEADGTYIYKVPTEAKSQSMSFKFGSINPYRITSADGTFTFSDMYGTDPLVSILVDYEWHLVTGLGKMGVQLGSGLTSALGSGRFKANTSQVAKESYTIYGIPLNLGFTYRFQYAHRQWIAPYLVGGGSYFGMLEVRDDNKINTAAVPAVYAGGGALFNITAIDRETGVILDSEYGVGNLWLSIEFRKTESLNNSLNITSDMLSGGFYADF